jgi:hypothetical protein
MKFLLLLVALVASCAPKTYTWPKVGMDYVDFMRLCGTGLRDDTTTVTNTQGTTSTITLRSDGEDVVWLGNANANRTERGCVGKFVFMNGKLDSIIN